MAPPSRVGPRRAQGREKLLRALAVVVEDLLDDGAEYADVTVLDLCARADVSRSTFYLHFRDKGELLVAMTEHIQAFFVDIVRTWWEADTDMSPEDMGETVGLLAGAYVTHEGLLRAVMDTAPYDDAVASAFDGMVATIRTGLEDHVRRGIAAGHLDPGLDPGATAGWLVCLFERGLHQLMHRAEPDEVDALTEAATTLVWRALYADLAAAA